MKDTSKEMDEVQMNDEGLDTSPTPLSASSTKVETVSAEEVDDDWSLYDTYSRDYRYIPFRDRKEKKKRTNMFGESYYEPTTHTGYPTRHSVSTWASRGYFHGSVYSGGYSYGSSLLSSYSFYAKFDNLKTEREILSKGIVRVRELITVLNIPRRVYVKIKGDGVGDNSCSDTIFSGVDSLTSDESSVILYLQTKVLTDSSKTTEDKINIITAEGIHECAHILYTNNKILLDFIASLPKALSKFYGKLAEGDRKSDSDPDFGIEAKTVFEKRNTIYSEVTKLNEFFGQDRNGLRCEDYSTRTEAINCLKCYKSLYPEEYERGERTAKCNLLLDPREDYSEAVTRVANIVLRDDLLKINRVIQLIVLFSTTIEDGRVETLLVSERPGIKDYLSILNKYQEKHISDNLDASDVITDRELRSVIIDILRVIKGLKSPETKLEIEISEGILMEDSTSTYDSCRKAFKIYKKLEAWYQNESGPDKAETLADSFSVKNESNGLDRLIGMFLSPSSNLNDDSTTVEGDEELTIDTFYTKSMTDILNDGSSGRTLNKLDSIWTRLSKDISTSVSSEIARSNSIISGILNESVEEVTSPYDSKKSTFFLKIKKVMKESPRTHRMKMLSSKVANYSNVLKKSILSKFKNEKFKFYGCKTGTLDPTKIVEAYQGVENVYTQPAAYETKKVVLSILLDESGSMDWKGRVDLVKQAAALLIQAFGDSEYVDLYIYGHTADIITGEETSVYVYKEGSERGSRLIEDINRLSYVSAKSQNRDGTAIYEVAKRVNKKAFNESTPDKDKKSIMIVMSDGLPEASGYGGMPAVRETRKMVTKAQEEFGVSIIQCTIGEVSRSEEMFDTVIKLENDLPNFVQNLSNAVRRLLDDQIETKIRRF